MDDMTVAAAEADVMESFAGGTWPQDKGPFTNKVRAILWARIRCENIHMRWTKCFSPRHLSEERALRKYPKRTITAKEPQ